MEVDPELVQIIASGLFALGATVATYVAKKAKKKLLKALEDLKVSEEQADMMLDKVGTVIPEKHQPMYRTLRTKWDDPVVTTDEFARVIDAFK